MKQVMNLEYVMARGSTDWRILIVEDQKGPCAALKVILSPFYGVDTAETACAALEILDERPIDLVIMDVGLPDYSGIELLRQLRASGSDVKAIVMSGGGSLESAMEVMRLGAVAYLLKPFNLQEVLVLIRDALQSPDAA